jgi:hypothetical protein
VGPRELSYQLPADPLRFGELALEPLNLRAAFGEHTFERRDFLCGAVVVCSRQLRDAFAELGHHSVEHRQLPISRRECRVELGDVRLAARELGFELDQACAFERRLLGRSLDGGFGDGFSERELCGRRRDDFGLGARQSLFDSGRTGQFSVEQLSERCVVLAFVVELALSVVGPSVCRRGASFELCDPGLSSLELASQRFDLGATRARTRSEP